MCIRDRVSSIEELLSKVDCILTVKDQVAVQSTYAFTRLYPAPLPVKVCDNYGEAIIRLKNGQGVAVLNADSADICLLYTSRCV